MAKKIIKKKGGKRTTNKALNDLERKQFLQYYLELKSGKDAYLKIRPKVKEHSAETLASKLLSKVEFDDLLDAAGATDEALAKGLGEGMNATRTISATVIIKSNDPTVKNKQATARDVDFIDVPDFMARHKYIETIARIKKKLIDRVALGTGENGEEPIRIILDRPVLPKAHTPK